LFHKCHSGNTKITHFSIQLRASPSMVTGFVGVLKCVSFAQVSTVVVIFDEITIFPSRQKPYNCMDVYQMPLSRPLTRGTIQYVAVPPSTRQYSTHTSIPVWCNVMLRYRVRLSHLEWLFTMLISYFSTLDSHLLKSLSACLTCGSVCCSVQDTPST